MLAEAVGTVPEAEVAVEAGAGWVAAPAPEGPVGVRTPDEAVPEVVDAAATGGPAGAEPEVEADGPEVCPPVETVPAVADEAGVPACVDGPVVDAPLPLAGIEPAPEGATAALGPTFTATSSSLVVPRRRS